MLNTAKVCVLRCSLSCRTCTDNQPTRCLSCFRGSTLANNTCVKDLTCNNDNSCTDCGQGAGFFKVASKCIRCPVIANSLQCSELNPQIPSVCVDGYYVNRDRCSICSSLCATCKS